MPESQDASLVLVVRGFDVLVVEREGHPILPAPSQVEPWLGPAPARTLLGPFGAGQAYAVADGGQADLPAGLRFVPARSLFDALDPDRLDLVGKALALVEFEATHRFCGRCGTPTVASQGERARHCEPCALTFYPRIPPAVITLVEREGEVLLARSARSRNGVFSAVAGFVEVGESLEQAAIREVREEVGVEVGDLRYFGSQPWPFGRSLMVGFSARHLAGDIAVDGEEIVEARWFRPDSLPPLPTPVSIARKMIDSFLRSRNAL